MFNQNELLSLEKVYKHEFTVKNISDEPLSINFFIRGFSEPHEVTFDPPHVALPVGASKFITVSIRFRCTANLLPHQVYVCGRLNNGSQAWGKVCGVEAHTDLSNFISCDDLELSSKSFGDGRYYSFLLPHHFLVSEQ